MIKLNEIKFRVGNTGKTKDGRNWASCLVYIDARCAMDMLDSEFQKGGWQFSWERVEDTKWAVKGKLKVYQNVTKEWVTFEDVGYPQESKTQRWSKEDNDMVEVDGDFSEWLKDAVSDSLKRCAVQVGIGRELYDAPFLYTEEVKLNNNGKVYGLTDNGNALIRANIEKWYKKLEGQK